MNKTFVISLGGSLINPGEIDTVFLNNFKKLILSEIKKGSRFILVCGGGTLCRKYQVGLSNITKTSNNDLDWIGVYATRLNAQLVRLIFGKLAYPEVIADPTASYSFKQKILIAAGWKPGFSTDFDAVSLAKTYKATMVINLSNIDYVYTKDPRKFPDAQKIETITWKNFRALVGSTWNPGANLPFDPIAATLAQKYNLTVVVANGKNLKNLKNILEAKKYIGTLITD